MKMRYFMVVAFVVAGLCSGVQAQQLSKKTKKTPATTGTSTSTNTSSSLLPLSEADITGALKEALTVGIKESSGIASSVDGFYKNPKIAIPWPVEAVKMKTALSNLGMSQQVASFEQSMNRAAEEASKGAFEVFVEVIKGMTIKDGISIVNGGNNAATAYLNDKASSSLSKKFTPIVKEAISKVKVTSYWNPLVTTYNKLPGVKKQNPNLEKYITEKTIDGLMTLIAEQEIKIRQDPAAQVTDILRRVFGK